MEIYVAIDECLYSFHEEEGDREVRFVEEVVMEGNPKAPKFIIEKHIDPPRDAYVQHVRLKARKFRRK